MPRLNVEYRGNQLTEFDLDSALNKNPQLILVDEMAHTNVPGLRHEKRWQDIKELLQRGIDVYTTLNVQHIESLKDDVATIIDAPIQETVPDTMLEMAYMIILVDLPTEELLKRLQEGKVYYPAQALLAQKNFFRKGNLNALRELALRITANQVSKQVNAYRQEEGIESIWATQDKIVVCVNANKDSAKLIRAAYRTATNFNAQWLAVYVETPGLKLSQEQSNSAIQQLHFANQLGAETHVLSGLDIVTEIINFAREQNVTQIMIWKNICSRFKSLWQGNKVAKLISKAGDIDVYVMQGHSEQTIKEGTHKAKLTLPGKMYWFAVGVVGLVTLINFLIYPFVTSASLMMIYLLGVTVIAYIGQTGPSIVGSVLSILAFDFFFIPPFYSFAVADIEYFFSLIVMLVVTQIISYLMLMTRHQITATRNLERQTSYLYSLSSQLAGTRGVNNLVGKAQEYLSQIFASEIHIFLDPNHPQPTNNAGETIGPNEKSIVQWVLDVGQSAGCGTETFSFSKALFMPMKTYKNIIGVIKVLPNTEQFFTAGQIWLLEKCVSEIALAIEADKIING
jgi:two-component system sensor histidine kinase KdpD